MKKLILSLFLYTGLSAAIYGQGQKPVLNAIKIEEAIALTGKLDNPAWSLAQPVELNYEIQPGDNTPATYRTLVRVLYDNENVYFGFECFDDKPEQIRANITDRDKLSGDDYMVILIDTYGDYQKSCEFKVNPFGIQGDELSSTNFEDPNVDWIWHSAASRNEDGWTAEIAIPFSSISFPDKEEQVWNLGITRNIPRDSRIQISWTRIDRNIPNYYIQLGLLKGLKDIKAGSSVEILPYVVGQKIGSLSNIDNPSSGLKFDPIQGRIGGGIKYSPSPNFAIDAVINPDFSQIESDADQISVNTTFALQYEEKRPFFLIGSEMLQTPMYYSRSINDPLTATRILGKSGPLSYMYMGAYDRNTIFVIPGEEKSNTVGTGLNSFVNIGRLRYEFENEAYIGAMMFSRNMSDAHNYVLGVDWRYMFWKNWNFSGEFFFSQTKELNDESVLSSTREFGSTGFNAAFNGEDYWGNGIHLNLSHSQRAYNFSVTINSFSPTYQAYNGAFNQNAFRQIYTSQNYVFYPENSFLDKGSVGIQSNLKFNYDGIKKEQVIQPNISLTFKGQTNVRIGYLLLNDEKFFGRDFKKIHRTVININSAPLNELSFNSSIQIGKFVYRSSEPQMGIGNTITGGLTIKPTSQLNLSFNYSRARLSNFETKELFYNGNIYRVVGNYQFTPEILFRTIFQYNTFNNTVIIYPLFSYKLSAFTTFYAGASSDYYDSHDGSLGMFNTGQQYFVKLQYLFRL